MSLLLKLTELDPHWITRDKRVVGVRFICPINDGDGPHVDGHSVCVLFSNPPDGGPPHPKDEQCPGNSDGRRWDRTGSTFEDLSLYPSVNCQTSERCPKQDHAQCAHTHCWHGHLKDGVVS